MCISPGTTGTRIKEDARIPGSASARALPGIFSLDSSDRPVGAGLPFDQADDDEIHGRHEQQENYRGHGGAQHAAGIVHPMKEHRGQIGKEQVNPAGGNFP